MSVVGQKSRKVAKICNFFDRQLQNVFDGKNCGCSKF